MLTLIITSVRSSRPIIRRLRLRHVIKHIQSIPIIMPIIGRVCFKIWLCILLGILNDIISMHALMPIIRNYIASDAYAYSKTHTIKHIIMNMLLPIQECYDYACY